MQSLLRKLNPHLAIAFRIVGPVLADLDEQEEVHRAFGEGGDFGA